MDEDVTKALTLPGVRYSRVWEDHRVLSKALCIQPQDTVLCITSAGDNVLNLLLEEPKKLVAIDLSIAQSSLLELKLAAIRCLCYEDFLTLLGETADSLGRWDEIYATVKQKGEMPVQTQQYWDRHYESLRSSGSWLGKFDKYVLGFSRDRLCHVLSKEQVDAFLQATSLDEQRQIFDHWPTDKLHEIYCAFASPSTQLEGRDAAQLKYVQQSREEVVETIWGRLRRTCRDVPVVGNFYLSWMLRVQRGYDPLIWPDYCPPCFTREGFAKLKGLINRVMVHNGAVENYFTATSEKPTKLALSDIFEYMSQEAADKLFETLACNVASGGRIVYWEFLNPRTPSAADGGQRLCLVEDLRDELLREDRSMWFVVNVLEVK